MQRLAVIRDLDDTQRSHAACSALAFFANLYTAVRVGHLLPRDIGWLYSEILDRCQDHLLELGGGSLAVGSLESLTVDELMKIVSGIMQDQSNALFQVRHRRPSINADADKKALSLQPSWAFEFWLDTAFEEAAKVEPSYAEVVGFCEAFLAPENRNPSAAIGRPNDVVWLTPNAGNAASALAQAMQLPPQDRERQLAASRLRDMLGLAVRSPREQAVVAHSRATIDEMARDPIARLSAPTVMDSRGYARYRHWPDDPLLEDGYGRTYDLDRSQHTVSGQVPGVREVVRRSMPLSEVRRFDYAGKIGPNPYEDGKPRSLAAEREFALNLSKGHDIFSFIDQLQRVLPV